MTDGFGKSTCVHPHQFPLGAGRELLARGGNQMLNFRHSLWYKHLVGASQGEINQLDGDVEVAVDDEVVKLGLGL